MTKVYFDTSVVIALSDLRDEFHHSSVGFVANLRSRGIITSTGPPFMLEVAKTAEMRDAQAALRLVRTVEEYEIGLERAPDERLWSLLDEYASQRVLASRRSMDLMHYASATLLGCTHLASWDRRHFSGRIGARVNRVNSSKGLSTLIVGDPITVARSLGIV